MVIADKGVSTHKKSDGKLIASAKYRRATPIEVKGKGLGNQTSGKGKIGNRLSGFKGFTDYTAVAGNAVALQTKGGDIAVYNLDDCTYKKVDARKNASLLISTDGQYVYVFEGGGMMSKSIVTKYKSQ